MKVWQLIAELSKLPAGADVVVSAYPGGTRNALQVVRYEDDEVQLDGTGEYYDDLQLAKNGTHERFRASSR